MCTFLRALQRSEKKLDPPRKLNEKVSEGRVCEIEDGLTFENTHKMDGLAIEVLRDIESKLLDTRVDLTVTHEEILDSLGVVWRDEEMVSRNSVVIRDEDWLSAEGLLGVVREWSVEL